MKLRPIIFENKRTGGESHFSGFSKKPEKWDFLGAWKPEPTPYEPPNPDPSAYYAWISPDGTIYDSAGYHGDWVIENRAWLAKQSGVDVEDLNNMADIKIRGDSARNGFLGLAQDRPWVAMFDTNLGYVWKWNDTTKQAIIQYVTNHKDAYDADSDNIEFEEISTGRRIQVPVSTEILGTLVRANPGSGTDTVNPQSWDTTFQDMEEEKGTVDKKPIADDSKMVIKYIPFKKKKPQKPQGVETSTSRKFNTVTNYGGDPAKVSVGPRGEKSDSSREYYYAPGEPGLTRAGLVAVSEEWPEVTTVIYRGREYEADQTHYIDGEVEYRFYPWKGDPTTTHPRNRALISPDGVVTDSDGNYVGKGIIKKNITASEFSMPYHDSQANQMPQNPTGFEDIDPTSVKQGRTRFTRRGDKDINIDTLPGDKSYPSGESEPQNVADIGMGNVLWPLASLHPVLFAAEEDLYELRKKLTPTQRVELATIPEADKLHFVKEKIAENEATPEVADATPEVAPEPPKPTPTEAPAPPKAAPKAKEVPTKAKDKPKVNKETKKDSQDLKNDTPKVADATSEVAPEWNGPTLSVPPKAQHPKNTPGETPDLPPAEPKKPSVDPSTLTWLFSPPYKQTEYAETHGKSKTVVNFYRFVTYLSSVEGGDPDLTLTFTIERGSKGKPELHTGSYDLSFYDQAKGQDKFGVTDLSREMNEDDVFAKLPKHIIDQAIQMVEDGTPNEPEKPKDTPKAEPKAEEKKVEKAPMPGEQGYNVLKDTALEGLNPPLTKMERLFTTIPNLAWQEDTFYADVAKLDPATLKMIKEQPKSGEADKYFSWLFVPKDETETSEDLRMRLGFTTSIGTDVLVVTRLSPWKSGEEVVQKNRQGVK